MKYEHEGASKIMKSARITVFRERIGYLSFCFRLESVGIARGLLRTSERPRRVSIKL